MNESGRAEDGAARASGAEDSAAADAPASEEAPVGPAAGPPPPPGPGDAPVRRELARDNERGLVTGVCAGLGAYTGIDPVVWRVGFAITGLAGFTGVLLYVGAWMAMRDSERGPAMFEQLLNRRIDDRAVPALLGLGVAGAVALSLIGGVGWGTLMLATPLILGALVAHNRGVDLRRVYRELPGLLKSGEPPPATPAPEPKPAYYNPAQPWAQAPPGPVDLAVVAGGERAGGADAAPRQEAAPPEADTAGGGGAACRPPFAGTGRLERRLAARERRRQRRYRRRAARGVRLLGFVWWAIVAAAAITLGATSTPVVEALLGPSTGPIFLGSVVVIVGIAAVVGTWVGDPRGLIAVGTVAAVLLVASAAVDLSSLRLGATHWRPDSAAAAAGPYALTGGHGRLDLTRLPLEPGQRVEVGAEVAFGGMTVLVPRDARVEVRGRAAFGEIRIGDTVRWGTGLDVRRTLEPAGASAAAGSGAGGQRIDRGADGGRERPSGGDREQEAGEPPVLVVDLVSRVGDMEVRRAPS
ncbi:PspC domain-containing protein [Streptomonospora sp. PA3]|uniref:PspC domain-containing protein n=1 Tax=Streptomonospora sp. PA3 TaxID=2607326 RepID=UPI0031BAE337